MRKVKSIRKTAVWVVVGSLGFLAFITSVSSELKKNKAEDVKFDGKFCSLPTSPAFWLGIAASVCLLCAHLVGIAAIGITYFSRDTKVQLDDKTKAITIALIVLSWACLAQAILLLGVASSMNQRQLYGNGWLDGECYIVRTGIYSGASLLTVITVISTLFVHLTITKRLELLLVVARPEITSSKEAGIIC